MKRNVFIVLTLLLVGAAFLVLNTQVSQRLMVKLAKLSFTGNAQHKTRRTKATEPPRYPPKGSEKVTQCKQTAKECHIQEQPIIYFVTPTYTRREQVAELTRLAQTLLHVTNLHWVIAEDSQACSRLISDLLQRYGIPYTHIVSPLPSIYKGLPKHMTARGVSSRRAALKWILQRHSKSCQQKAVVYFADDDNTYDLRIFEQMRTTEKVSVFPVGFIGYQSISSPIVRKSGQLGHEVIGFTDPWFEKRKFPIDMAGFAVSVDFIIEQGSNASMPYWVGHEEDQFLRSLRVEYKDLEAKANGCSEVLVWHTKTVSEKTPYLKYDKDERSDSNLKSLMSSLYANGVIALSNKRGYELLNCLDTNGCDTRKPVRYSG